MIGQTISHYRITEKLGEGGMGIVYIAEDTYLGRQVAIKTISPASDSRHFRTRFLREARAISALSHPNIATIYDYGETEDGRAFIVMEFISGRTLGDMLASADLDLSESLRIIESVAEALSAAHERGIVHRDIKPSNVMVNDKGQVKVLDFGLAKQINDSSSTDPDAQTLLATRTQSGVVVGTPLYLSPEQATGQAVDARSDLFALGALLYECVTGRAAFSGSSVLEIGAQVIHVNPEKPSVVNERVPETLDRVVMKAMAKKVGERYQSAEKMLRELREVHGELSDEDKHRTLRLSANSNVKPQPSALMTLNYKLGRPRLSIRFVLLVLLGASLGVWLITYWIKPRMHRPSAEAEQWYTKGTMALRDGAFYRASKALEQAVKADDKYALAHARLAEAQMELDYADRAKDELLKVGALVPDRSIMPQVDALYLEAINAFATRDFTRAIEAYQQILKLTPNDAPNKAQVYVDLGRAYEKNDEINKAIASYVEAAQREPGYATAYLNLGTLYTRKLDTASATTALDKAEAIFHNSSDIEGRTEVFYLRGILLRDSGKTDEAKRVLEEALKMARDNDNDTRQINILLQLGRVAYSEGEIEKATGYAEEAVAYAQQRGVESLVSRGINERGWASMASGQYDAAERDFRQALAIAQRNRLPYFEASSLYGLGSLYIQQLRTNEGLPYIRQALEDFKKQNYRKDISLASLALGRGYRRQGEYAAALETFEQKRKGDEETGDQRQLAFAYEGIASVYLEQGRYPEALDNYEKVLQISRALGDKQSMAYTLMNRGNVFWRLGHYDEANASLDQSATLAKEGRYNPASAEIETIRAQIALSQRRFQDARNIAQHLLDPREKPYPDLTVDAKYTLCLAQVLSGAGADGRRSCDEAVTTATHLVDTLRLSNAMLAQAEAELETNDTQNALTNALLVQDRFNRAGQQESEWRAWLIAALASRRQGNESAAREYLAHAQDVLSQLQQRWGPEAFNTYLNRQDIQTSHKQLGGG
jgi:serine/threonine protein kinase/tetratricopeptide (TPR) repeat protein